MTAAWHVVNGNTATKQYGCIGMACSWHYFANVIQFRGMKKHSC